MKRGQLMAVPALGWLALFFAVPLMIVVVISFLGRTPYGQLLFYFTVENYRRFFEPLYLNILFSTFGTAVAVTFITFLLGYPLAYAIARARRGWQKTGLLLVMIPFWINFLIRSYAWVIILRSQGVVNSLLLSAGLIESPLPLLYNDGAVLLGLVYAMIPFMVLPAYVSIEQLDQRLLEAASDLGASPLRSFFKITLPLTLPGIAAGSILVFISTLGMFVIPDIMGGAKSPLIGNLIQNQFLSARNWPFGSALSILLAFLSMLLIFLYYRALGIRKGGGLL
ncbi:MAG: ABC transporter permease [Acidaminococcales bacterium]|jgi:spermidine/putrescine transport system permease protein|nr:ABC transporter permease [Acidaminococcales bacterium]